MYKVKVVACRLNVIFRGIVLKKLCGNRWHSGSFFILRQEHSIFVLEGDVQHLDPSNAMLRFFEPIMEQITDMTEHN